MAMVQEWVKRRYVSFGAVAGEQVVIGDPIDVLDWEVAEVQVNVVQTNAANATDIGWWVETCISPNDYPKWDAVFSERDLPNSSGDSDVGRCDDSSTNPLRAWARIVLEHNVTTSGQEVTLQATVLYKKRVT